MTDLRSHMKPDERREYIEAERHLYSHKALAKEALTKMDKIRRAVRARLRRKAEKEN